jgi:hypothetical protein
MAAELFKKKPKEFKNLATAEDLAYLTRVYDEYFNDTADDDAPLIDPHSLLPFDFQDTGDGDLGIEVEQSLDPTSLAASLGFTRQRLPFQYNELRHVSGLTPWSDRALFDAKPIPNSLIRNELHWHQLGAVHSIVRNIFTSAPDPTHCAGVLICDEVGLGKTAQAISVIAFLNQCIFLQGRGMDVPPVLRGSFLYAAVFIMSSPTLRWSKVPQGEGGH